MILIMVLLVMTVIQSVVKQLTNVKVVINLKECQLEPVAVVESGQMKHQPVNVRSNCIHNIMYY